MKSSASSSLQFLLFTIFTILSISIPATTLNFNFIPRLSPISGSILENPEEILSSSDDSDLKTYYYNQTLDHFNYKPESYSTFPQRYVISFKFWGGANSTSPIFAYFGAEQSLDSDLNAIGFLSDNAARFNALVVYIEHRYYGKSIPFGSRKEAYENASTLGYFNSAQAIADYADILLHIKKIYHAQDSPVIVLGGSYGGSNS